MFTSEAQIISKNSVEEIFQILKDQDLVYYGKLEPPKGKTPDDWEPTEQWLFKSSQFGDDVDRPLKKSDGTWAYFAPDIAYHYDKF